MRRNLSPVWLLLTLFLAIPFARAEEEDEAAARERGKALLASLKTFDESLTGTTFYGIYAGTKNIGTIKTVVEKAPEDTAGVYQAVFEMKMKIGSNEFSSNSRDMLDGSFAVLSHASLEEDPNGPATEKRSLKDGRWTLETSKGEESAVFGLAAPGPDHGEKSSHWLLARRIRTDEKRLYLLKGIAWPKATDADPEASGETELDASVYKDIRIAAAPPAPFEHRGASVTARVVTVTDTKGETTSYAVGPGDKVLAFWPGDAPIKIIAGTEEEAGADLAEEAISDEARAVKDAVLVYFRVAAKAVDVDEIDKVIDWASVGKQLAELNPMFKDMDAEQVAGIVKMQLANSPASVPKDQLDILEAMLKVSVDGDKASVKIKGEGDKPFRLEKRDGKWIIVQLPI